jgi:hypothetical protein
MGGSEMCCLEEVTALHATIVDELKACCLKQIDFIDEKLLPARSEPEQQLCYQKLKGDRCRSRAETTSETDKE